MAPQAQMLELGSDDSTGSLTPPKRDSPPMTVGISGEESKTEQTQELTQEQELKLMQDQEDISTASQDAAVNEGESSQRASSPMGVLVGKVLGPEGSDLEQRYSNHTALGVANLNVSECLHFLPPDEDESFHSIEGTPHYVHCQWVGCMPDERIIWSKDGDVLVDNMGLYNFETLDDPETQLVGKPWCFCFNIDRLTGGHQIDGVLPFVCKSVYCTYTFRGQEYRTETVLNTDTPVFNFSCVHRVEKVDLDFIHEMQTKACRVWVFVQKEASDEEEKVVESGRDQAFAERDEVSAAASTSAVATAVANAVATAVATEIVTPTETEIETTTETETETDVPPTASASASTIAAATAGATTTSNCIVCGLQKSKKEYTNSQWKKNRKKGKAKCKECAASNK